MGREPKIDQIWQWCADRIPHSVVYFVLIRAWAFVLEKDEDVTAITMDTVICRWEKKKRIRESYEDS